MKCFPLVLACIAVLALFPLAAAARASAPRPPSSVTIYSDYRTKTQITLNWNDPQTDVDGAPLGPFDIVVERDGQPLVTRAQGSRQYVDGGLTDGRLYTYALRARVIETGERSEPVEVSWHAGGDPVPAAPTEVTVTPTLAGYRINWKNPSTQRDGTPLDDFEGVRLRRNGAYIAFLPANTRVYVDPFAPPGSSWDVSVADGEQPPNVSAWSEPAFAPPPTPDVRVASNSIHLIGSVNGPTIQTTISMDNIGDLPAFFTSSHGSGWLTASPESGTLSAFTQAILTLRADPSGLAAGIYADTMVIESNDPEDPVVRIPVTFDIGSTRARFEPEILTYSILVIDQEQTRDFRIVNDGNRRLDYTLSTAATWLTISNAPTYVGPGDSVTRHIAAVRNQPVGIYTDSLVVVSNDAERGRVVIPVFLEVYTTPPTLVLSRESLSFSTFEGDPPPDALPTRIDNPGAETLVFSISTDQEWIVVNTTAGALGPRRGQDVTVGVKPGGLSPGTYAGNVLVDSNDPDRGHVAIPVTLTVQNNAPILSFAPGDTLRYPNAACSDVSASLTLRNYGHGSLHVTLSSNVPWLPLANTAVSVAGGSAKQVSLTALRSLLPEGVSRGSIVITSDDPARPIVVLPVVAMRLAPAVELETHDLHFVAAVNGNRQTKTILVESTGMVTADLTPSGSVPPWISDLGTTLTLPPGSFRRLVVTVDPRQLGPGTHTATLLYQSNLCAGFVPINVRVDVNEGLPELVIGSGNVAIDGGEGGYVTGRGLDLVNQAPRAFHFEVAESAPWLLATPVSGTIEAGERVQLGLTAAAAGLPPGVHNANVTVTSDDPANPSRTIPVSFTVHPVPADVDFDRFGVQEILFDCGSGTGAQFIELAAFEPGVVYDASTGIEIRDSGGDVAFEASDLFGPSRQGRPWAQDDTWLLATDAARFAGTSADGVVPLHLDPVGGTIAVFTGSDRAVVQRFSYGSVHGTNPPPPGSSLHRISPGVFTAGFPTPRSVGGPGSGAVSCTCPDNVLSAGPSVVTVNVPSRTTRYDTGSRNATSGYDLSEGTFFVQARRTTARTTVTDVFTIRGDRAGVPVRLQAVVHVTGRMRAAGTGSGQDVSASVSLAQDDLPAAGIERRAPGFPETLDEEFVLPIEARFQIPFRLGGTVTAVSGIVAETDEVNCTITFRNLPAGSLVNSCQGYQQAADEAPDATVVSTSGHNGTAKIEWFVPVGPRLATVERRIPDGIWAAYASVEIPESGDVTFEDAGLDAGTYQYRLVYAGRFGGETELTVTPAGALILVPVFPNPVRGGRLTLDVVLPTAAPARLELFDVSGRRVVAKDLDGKGPGEVRVEMTDERTLASGVYLARLVQGSKKVSAKIVVLK